MAGRVVFDDGRRTLGSLCRQADVLYRRCVHRLLGKHAYSDMGTVHMSVRASNACLVPPWPWRSDHTVLSIGGDGR